MPLIVPDDDISGTFGFLKAMPDYGYSKELSATQIGQTWLNYLIEERTVLWWGGLGNLTEHTAYLRLKNGIQAPASGLIGLNSKVVAEQIGSQIFIDGWAMVTPGDPEYAASLAGRAAVRRWSRCRKRRSAACRRQSGRDRNQQSARAPFVPAQFAPAPRQWWAPA